MLSLFLERRILRVRGEVVTVVGSGTMRPCTQLRVRLVTVYGCHVLHRINAGQGPGWYKERIKTLIIQNYVLRRFSTAGMKF